MAFNMCNVHALVTFSPNFVLRIRWVVTFWMVRKTFSHICRDIGHDIGHYTIYTNVHRNENIKTTKNLFSLLILLLIMLIMLIMLFILIMLIMLILLIICLPYQYMFLCSSTYELLSCRVNIANMHQHLSHSSDIRKHCWLGCSTNAIFLFSFCTFLSGWKRQF